MLAASFPVSKCIERFDNANSSTPAYVLFILWILQSLIACCGHPPTLFVVSHLNRIMHYNVAIRHVQDAH